MDFFSIINLINGDGEVGNKVEIDKQNQIFEELSKVIKKAYTIKGENEIKQILKKGNVREFFSKSWVEGICYPNLKTICINPYIIEKFINGEINNTIIHETIHLLRGIQNSSVFKLEKNIIGFEEGATEYMTYKAIGTLGEKGSNYLLKKIQNTCGKDFYEHLRKKLNEYTSDNRNDVLELQSELLKRCYDSKFTQIENIEDAANLFKELQEINKVRAHFKGDTSFKDFYEEKYKECNEKFGENFENLENLKYQEIKFLNVISRTKIKNIFDKNIRKFICSLNSSLENGLEKINNTKRYVALHQETLYQIAIFKDRVVQFSVGNEKEGTAAPTQTSISNEKEEMHKLRKSPSMPKFDSDFYLKKSNEENNQSYTLIIDGEEVELREIDLGVTKEDVESYYSLENSFVQEKTFKERFLSLFSKKKTKLLNAPENKEYTKKEADRKNFSDSIRTEVVNNMDSPITTSIQLDQESLMLDDNVN